MRVTSCTIEEEIKKWAEIEGRHQTKSLLGLVLSRDTRRVERILALEWGSVNIVTELLIGHGSLKHHTWKMGLSTSAKCRFCKKAKDTLEHVLCSCPVFNKIKRENLFYCTHNLVIINCSSRLYRLQ